VIAPERAPDAPPQDAGSALAVLRNRPFLLLWLAQVATQIGVNMVLYGLTVVVLEATDLSAAVSGLFLTFLVPSVLFSALIDLNWLSATRFTETFVTAPPER